MHRQPRVMAAQPVDEFLRLLVPPHPPREVVEDAHLVHIRPGFGGRFGGWWVQARVTVNHPRVGPVSFYADCIEPVLGYQALGYGRPGAVEF